MMKFKPSFGLLGLQLHAGEHSEVQLELGMDSAVCGNTLLPLKGLMLCSHEDSFRSVFCRMDRTEACLWLCSFYHILHENKDHFLELLLLSKCLE